MQRTVGARFTAVALVSWMTPPFVAAYAGPMGYATSPDTDAVFTMAGPRADRFKCGAAYWVVRK